MLTTEAVTAGPNCAVHRCAEGAAKVALTGAASELVIMMHLFTVVPEEILTTSHPKCEPGGEELKRDTVKGAGRHSGPCIYSQRRVVSHTLGISAF